MWGDDAATSVRYCLCKLQTSQDSSLLNSPIHQAKTNISVPGWGPTSHGTGSAISFGGWTLEGKVALLVTPQNAKTAIMAYGAAMSGIFELCCLDDWQHPKFIHRSWNKTEMRGFLQCENTTFLCGNIWNFMTTTFVCTQVVENSRSSLSRYASCYIRP